MKTREITTVDPLTTRIQIPGQVDALYGVDNNELLLRWPTIKSEQDIVSTVSETLSKDRLSKKWIQEVLDHSLDFITVQEYLDSGQNHVENAKGVLKFNSGPKPFSGLTLAIREDNHQKSIEGYFDPRHKRLAGLIVARTISPEYAHLQEELLSAKRTT